MVAGSDTAFRNRITPAIRARVRHAGRAALDGLGAAKVAMLSKLPERFHAITDEMAKFGTIGLINLAVNFAVFNALLMLASGSEVKAKAVATIVAATSAYFLNRHWTYRHRPKTTLRREYSLFFFFNAVGLVIEAGIVGLAKYGFDQTSFVVLNLCNFVGIALGTVFRFWAYRTHVFKPVPQEPITATPLTAPAPLMAAPALVDTEPPAFTEPTLVSQSFSGVFPADLNGTVQDDDLREELVQLELDELLDRDGMVVDGTDPAARR
jgi:putative flippase GtrA